MSISCTVKVGPPLNHLCLSHHNRQTWWLWQSTSLKRRQKESKGRTSPQRTLCPWTRQGSATPWTGWPTTLEMWNSCRASYTYGKQHRGAGNKRYAYCIACVWVCVCPPHGLGIHLFFFYALLHPGIVQKGYGFVGVKWVDSKKEHYEGHIYTCSTYCTLPV